MLTPAQDHAILLHAMDLLSAHDAAYAYDWINELFFAARAVELGVQTQWTKDLIGLAQILCVTHEVKA
jgi:hypothetical protein